MDTMADQTVLVLGITGMPDWGQDQVRRLVRQARRRGLRVLAADTPQALQNAPEEHLALVDEAVALDVQNAERCRAWAATDRPAIDAVVTVREMSVLPAAVIAQELGLGGNAPEAVACLRSKDLCRRRLRESGLPQPASALCTTAEDAEAFMRATAPGPWVVKPRDGLGSVAVSRVHDIGELPVALARFTGPLFASLHTSPGFLVETYVTGEEYSAEGVVVGGEPQVLALTRKTIADGFISTSQRVPSGLDPAIADEAADAVAKGLKALGITHGIFHIELWVTSAGIVLGEYHIRPGGDYIHALVEAARPGLELYGMLLDDLLGRVPTPAPELTRAARAQFLFAPPGRLRAVHGWHRVTGHPAVRAAHLQVSPGDVIEPEPNSFTRSAAFVVATDTQENAVRHVDELATTLASQVIFDVA